MKKEAIRILTGVVVGAGITAVCPPLALALGLAQFLKSARKTAYGDEDAARDMIMSYVDITQTLSLPRKK